MPETDRNTQWGIAEQWVYSAAESGITSADKFYSWLRENEFDVTRGVAREVWRNFIHSEAVIDLIANYPKSLPVPRSWYTPTESDYIKGYAYKFNVTYYDTEDDTIKTRTILQLSDSRITLQEAEDYISTLPERDSPPSIGEIISWKFITMYHRKGAAW